MATCNFGNFQFWQLAILATCNFGNLQFWQLTIWQLSILTTFSFDNFQFWLFSSKIFELIQQQEEHIDCMDLAIKNIAGIQVLELTWQNLAARPASLSAHLISFIPSSSSLINRFLSEGNGNTWIHKFKMAWYVFGFHSQTRIRQGPFC